MFTMRGKEIRLERIMNRNTKKTVIVPMDHGVTNGPIPGLIDMGQTVNLVADGGANAVIGMRYDATEVMQGVTEVLAYGTAVVVQKEG